MALRFLAMIHLHWCKYWNTNKLVWITIFQTCKIEKTALCYSICKRPQWTQSPLNSAKIQSPRASKQGPILSSTRDLYHHLHGILKFPQLKGKFEAVLCLRLQTNFHLNETKIRRIWLVRSPILLIQKPVSFDPPLQRGLVKRNSGITMK